MSDTAPINNADTEGDVGLGEEEMNSIIIPAGASFHTEYIMDVRLETKDGVDIPIYNQNLITFGSTNSHYRLWIDRRYGDKSEYFHQDDEDYWLFHLHLNRSEVEIAIGGETPVLVNSKPSWKNISSEEKRSIMVTNKHNYKFKLWYEFTDEKNHWYDRFLAVRCPRMDNPAITIKTIPNDDGSAPHYAGVHWVGLFVKTCTDDTHQFVAVRTTNRLLPEYGERVKNCKWFRPDGAADITNRTLTLFPKQLYGSRGNRADLYDQFVTPEPGNELGPKHFELVRRRIAEGAGLQSYKYVWHATGKTLINLELTNGVRYPQPPFRGVPAPQESHSMTFDYISGLRIEAQPLNGWNILLTAFGSTVEIVMGIVTGNVSGAFKGFIDFVDMFDEEKMRQDADVKGFITIVGKAVDDYNKHNKGKKKEVKPPNTNNIIIIRKNIRNRVVSVREFGTAAQTSRRPRTTPYDA